MRQLPNPRQSYLRSYVVIFIIAFVALQSVFYFAGKAFDAQFVPQQVQPHPQVSQPYNPEAWLAVGQEKALSDFETVRMLEVNSSILGYWQTECLLYTNTRLGTSTLTCSK